MLLEHIQGETRLTRRMVDSLVKSAPYRYKVYTVAKKHRKGQRTIAQPAKEVKLLQRMILDKVIVALPVHSAAFAYRKNHNIRMNAEIHVHNNFLLKMDFTDFFPSLRHIDLEQHIRLYASEQYSPEDFFVISRVCFWRPKGTNRLQLSIGAPSSPSISNTLMYDFDSRVSDICYGAQVTYSRYADDLTFSTSKKGVLRQIESSIRGILTQLRYPRLEINHDKTIHTSKKHHRRVTGIVLSSDGKISLGRKNKRTIRAMMHHACTDTISSEERDRLQGLLAFSHDVEPGFVDRLREKYSSGR